MISLKRFLYLVAANVLFAGFLLQGVTHHLWAVGALPEYSRGTVIHDLRELASLTQDVDSWKPMLAALPYVHDPVGVYQAAFLNHGIKFQYPLPSLIPMWLMERAGLDPSAIVKLLKPCSAAALILTIVCCCVIAFKSVLPGPHPLGKAERLRLGAVALLVSLTFYPAIWAYSLGQVQVFLNLLFSLAFLCWLQRRERIAGVFIGLITLIKPQYALILLWGFLRKRWSFAVSGLACALVGLTASCLLFGFRNNLQYLRVLSFLSRHGEAFYPNQSVNGLLNRLTGVGGNVLWKAGFPPYHPAIYVATIVTSLAILVWAVPIRPGSSETSRVLDFSLIGLAATAASPIAWEHHYGIVLPMLTWQLGAFVAGCRLSRMQSAALVASYLLIANDLRITNLLSRPPWNIVQSYMFFGVLIFLWLLRSELKPRHLTLDASVRDPSDLQQSLPDQQAMLATSQL